MKISEIFIFILIVCLTSCYSKVQKISSGHDKIEVNHLLDISYESFFDVNKMSKSFINKIERRLGHNLKIVNFDSEENNLFGYDRLIFYKKSNKANILCLRSRGSFTTNDWYFYDKENNNLFLISTTPKVDELIKLKSCINSNTCFYNSYNL